MECSTHPHFFPHYPTFTNFSTLFLISLSFNIGFAIQSIKKTALEQKINIAIPKIQSLQLLLLT